MLTSRETRDIKRALNKAGDAMARYQSLIDDAIDDGRIAQRDHQEMRDLLAGAFVGINGASLLTEKYYTQE